MDWFDDVQIEDLCLQDFSENSVDELYADDSEEKFFTQLKTQYDF